MADSHSEDPDALVDVAEAAALLEVAPDRVPVMVDEGLLTPVDGSGELQFRRAEVIAAREVGG